MRDALLWLEIVLMQKKKKLRCQTAFVKTVTYSPDAVCFQVRAVFLRNSNPTTIP
jgi:hypothetical protein